MNASKVNAVAELALGNLAVFFDQLAFSVELSPHELPCVDLRPSRKFALSRQLTVLPLPDILEPHSRIQDEIVLLHVRFDFGLDHIDKSNPAELSLLESAFVPEVTFFVVVNPPAMPLAFGVLSLVVFAATPTFIQIVLELSLKDRFSFGVEVLAIGRLPPSLQLPLVDLNSLFVQQLSKSLVFLYRIHQVIGLQSIVVPLLHCESDFVLVDPLNFAEPH
jgi:hypothetical protein